MNLYLEIFEELPQKTPESKADSAYLSPSSDYFWWFDGWSMHQYSQVLRVGVDVPICQRKIRQKCEIKSRFLRKKTTQTLWLPRILCCWACSSQLPLYPGLGTQWSSRLGMHVENHQESGFTCADATPPSRHFMTLRHSSIMVALSLFASGLKKTFWHFGIWCIYFHVFWVYFLPPASSCMAQCVNDVPLRWPGCPSGSLVRWLAPQSQVLRGRRKVLENVIVQSYQIYANMVEKLNRSNQKLAHRAGLWIFFDTCHISSI